MIVRLLLTVGVLVLAGCLPVSSASPGSSVHTLNVDGLDRTYRLYVPDDLPPSAPLVVMLHGGFGSAEQAERAYGWDELAESAGFVVVYPDGVNRAWNVGGGCCGRPSQDGVDDVGFISSVVDDVSSRIGVDAARVYATGISNGGMMAYALACNTDRFTAIGPDSATQLDACASPRPTSVIHIHGTDDRLIRYDGEPGVGVARIDGLAVPELNSWWRTVDGCGDPTVSVDGATTTSDASCADGRRVVLMTVDGGGHDWPDFATQAVWEFFASA